MKRHLLCALVLGIALATTALGADRYEVSIERGVAVKMRDGVTLRADIYRPKAEGKFPVLLQRTPYDKNFLSDLHVSTAARGYVVIIQDVRGRFTSEGEWRPFQHESQDGYDTVEWAAALPYSDGKVGMFGGSYVGATQMLTAIAQPPHLAGICPVITASNYHDGWTYQGGAFELWFNASWTTFLAQDTMNRATARAPKPFSQWVTKLPLSSYPVLNVDPGDLAPYYFEWLAHPNYDEFWKRISIEDQHSKIQVPVYNIGGWYDIFLLGTARNYVGIRAHGGSEAARSGQRLTLGPWYHGPFDGRTGEVDFGPAARSADGSPFDYNAVMLRWYDHLLKGMANGVEREKSVKIFVMGENAWREEDDWPLARAKNTRYHLHSGGNANSLTGDGTLSPDVPQTEPTDHFVYSPAEPVPTRGGGLCCDNERQPSGAFDQRPVESRGDVLVFTTSEFKTDFEVTGPVSLEFFASSSSVDTDFTAKLVDVWPNGFAQNLTDGIVRARYRNSSEKPEFMNPGEVYKFTIDVGPTSNVFKAGHRLRVEISSSNFPRFDRNLNTGEDSLNSTRFVKASNTIYHDREHPSALILPVVPR
jgi:putative CocE/NonD family hydrolase